MGPTMTARAAKAGSDTRIAAFDKYLIGVRPDGLIEVRRDILEEHDGPMLRHGLKRLHQTRIYRPRSKANKPDPELLEYRYRRFVNAAGNAPLATR